MINESQFDIADRILKFGIDNPNRFNLDDLADIMEENEIEYSDYSIVLKTLLNNKLILDGPFQNSYILTVDGRSASEIGIKSFIEGLNQEASVEKEFKEKMIEQARIAIDGSKSAKLRSWVAIAISIVLPVSLFFADKNYGRNNSSTQEKNGSSLFTIDTVKHDIKEVKKNLIPKDSLLQINSTKN